MFVLGIETSCDETSASVLSEGSAVLSNVISSQEIIHGKYGGVVPELASRNHLEMISAVVDGALAEAGIGKGDIGLVAVTAYPGLIGSLLVGLSFAKAFAWVLDIPMSGIHHIEGHIFSPFIESNEIQYPFISLVASGGHTDLILVKKPGDYLYIGRTIDDAAGECIDKVAKYLGYPYPGGPVLDGISVSGDRRKIRFPVAKVRRNRYDFSYSGLKTHMMNFYESGESGKFEEADIIASFLYSVVRSLTEKAAAAGAEYSCGVVAAGGGVAANSMLREELEAMGVKHGLKICLPGKKYCTDNGAMIAKAGWLRHGAGLPGSDMYLNAEARKTL